MRESRRQEIFECMPEVDYDAGYRYFLGNRENYFRALLATLKSVKSKLPIIQTMMTAREYEGLRSIVQTLQKMFTNIGANGMAEEAYQLEKVLLNGELSLKPDILETYAQRLAIFSVHLEEMLQKVEIRKTMDREADDAPAFFHHDFTRTRESIKRTSDILERKISS